MKGTLWRAAPLALLLVSGVCAFTAAAAARDPDRVALEAAIQRWVTAVNAQDAATLAQTMTEDVELLEHSATVKGRNAAIRKLREVVAHGPLVATSRELTIAQDTAWHVVKLVQTRKSGDLHTRGQALEIWKRADGSWQLHRQVTALALSPEHHLQRPSTKEPVLDRPVN
jgi:ketosteroid isomerase-like protein